jgi:hypothetical protein
MKKLKRKMIKKMKKGIEAVIISVDEPQLDRCIESVNNQIVKFNNVRHLNKVLPVAKAFNEAFSKSEYPYVLPVFGDVILKKDALATMLRYINGYKPQDKIYNFRFGVFDTFTHEFLKGMRVHRTKVSSLIPYSEEELRDDVIARDKAIEMGFKEHCFFYDKQVVIGTHFDRPSEKQVYVRFYIDGCKTRKTYTETGRMFDRTKQQLYCLSQAIPDPLYKVALQAWDEGYKNFDYDFSHNYKIEQQIYKRYLESC